MSAMSVPCYKLHAPSTPAGKWLLRPKASFVWFKLSGRARAGIRLDLTGCQLTEQLYTARAVKKSGHAAATSVTLHADTACLRRFLLKFTLFLTPNAVKATGRRLDGLKLDYGRAFDAAVLETGR